MKDKIGTATAIGGVIAALIGVLILDPVAVFGGIVVMVIGMLIQED